MAKELYYLPDNELGNIYIRIDIRAKRLIMRTDPHGQTTVTVPPGTTEENIYHFINKYRSELREIKRTARPKPLIGWDFHIDAPLFSFRIQKGTGTKGQLIINGTKVELVCPADTDLSQEAIQEWMKKVVETALVKQAEVQLPNIVRCLAEQNRFSYHSAKVNRSKSRWGSCSTRRDINLSCWLMTLPEHLLKYVILHELCHTIEMNHSERFWALLDRCTGGQSRSLREELKSYHTCI